MVEKGVTNKVTQNLKKSWIMSLVYSCSGLEKRAYFELKK